MESEKGKEQLPDYRGSLKPTAWSAPKPKRKRKRSKPEFVQKPLL